ncbi:urease accessory protein UreF [Bradyrhizobium sp. SSBR45G]|uniref:urease accessory protein UreF n=1 Tax=unclassified Bradyrhizobium TaxID=2631580 RepID=UPI002342A876|nr:MULTISPECIES: urease accessory UreF family protein [unclassified Bradyrhizobium]GLH75985.1 urease accessory protein UreF [Bradyrhizobium sp. SSBR45G]GLH89240.1 urease accessory protein UreF [Bradyrhizobium sp. SSBR45R]
MFDRGEALALLQLGDSAFPAGGFAFSWGIEGLAADGHLSGHDDLDGVIADHLAQRWATMDRILLRRAWRASDTDAIASVDRLAEATTPSAEMRDGSRRAGRALLGVWGKLAGPLSVAYRERVSADARLGHLPVVQAITGRDAGLGLDAAELVSGWTLITGLVSAAVRLGLIGHIDSQQSLARARALLADLLTETPDDDAMPSSFTPFIDIAVSRGPLRHVRMFTT